MMQLANIPYHLIRHSVFLSHDYSIANVSQLVDKRALEGLCIAGSRPILCKTVEDVTDSQDG